MRTALQLLTADSAVVHGPGGSIGDAESYFLRIGTTVPTGGPQRLARVFLPPPAMAGGKWVASEGRDSRGRGAGSHVEGSDPSGRAEVGMGSGARDRPEAWNDAGFAVLGGGAAGWSECRVLQRLGEATYVVHLVSADRQAIYHVCCVCVRVCVCVCLYVCVCVYVYVYVCVCVARRTVRTVDICEWCKRTLEAEHVVVPL